LSASARCDKRCGEKRFFFTEAFNEATQRDVTVVSFFYAGENLKKVKGTGSRKS